jgi:hypothetical protein
MLTPAASKSFFLIDRLSSHFIACVSRDGR